MNIGEYQSVKLF